MTANTKIEWATHTFNPWIGCAKVSPGCAHCYAEVSTPARVSRSKGLELWGPGAARHVVSDAEWRKPLRWDREAADAGERHRVFCASLADVFEDREDLDEHRARLLCLIECTPHLDWLLLTKRPERVPAVLLRLLGRDDTLQAQRAARIAGEWLSGKPKPNVWMGTTVEDQARADTRIPALLRIPARVRFLSCEPLLEHVDLARACFNGADSFGTMPGIDWVIIGGESGPRARPFDVAWARSLVEQVRRAGAAPFVKQLGAFPLTTWDDPNRIALTRTLCLRHPKGGEIEEWPPDLQVREIPAVSQ